MIATAALSAEIAVLGEQKREAHQRQQQAHWCDTQHAMELTNLELRLQQLNVARHTPPATYPLVYSATPRFNTEDLQQVVSRLAGHESHRYSAPAWPGGEGPHVSLEPEPDPAKQCPWHELGIIALYQAIDTQGRGWKECGIVLATHSGHCAEHCRVYFPEGVHAVDGDSVEVPRTCSATKIRVGVPGDPGYWLCLMWIMWNLQDLPRQHPSSLSRWINLTATRSIQDCILHDPQHRDLKKDICSLYYTDGNTAQGQVTDELLEQMDSLHGPREEEFPPHCLCAGDIVTVHFADSVAKDRPSGWYQGVIVGQVGDCWSSVLAWSAPKGQRGSGCGSQRRLTLREQKGNGAWSHQPPER